LEGSTWKAQLVISPDAGFGKSHLLGRLFQSLGERATLIYLRPFQDPDRVWSSILLATVQELDRPDQSGQRAATQLEAFATGVLANVAADFMTSRGLDKQRGMGRVLRESHHKMLCRSMGSAKGGQSQSG
jgi:hypothetical protein